MKKIWQNKMLRADLLLILGLLLLGGILFAVTRGGESGSGASVVVFVDGEETERYPLDKNGTFQLNGGTNTLVIENGYAWLSDAQCPDQLCVHMGKIHNSSGIIVCLPNRLYVTIEGVDDPNVDVTVG